MGFLSNLFNKGEDPDTTCADEVLGTLKWSDDDEAWIGEFNGIKFSLAYDRTKQPTRAVVAYAREILTDSGWLAASLAEAKEQAKKGNHNKFYLDELESLSLGRVHFFMFKGNERRILADLDGGKDYRLWRIEYSDRTCDGIGFDH